MTAKVLFVDDEEANLLVCEAACRGQLAVSTAQSAELALEYMKREEVGVVVADQRMPGVTGVDLLEKVRLEYPDTVRVLITAYSDMPVAIDAINRGHVRRYLKKPWEPHELVAEMRDALEVYEMGHKLRVLERRLSEAERLYTLGVVVAGIAHEIRNPIGWISSNVAHAQQELRSLARDVSASLNPDQLKARLASLQESLEDANYGAARVSEIIQGIELSSRKPSSQPEIVDLSEVLRLALRLLYGEIKSSARLELDVTCSPRVRGTNTKVGQVVLNLLVNAMQAMAGRPQSQNVISARLKLDGPWACLEIADSGDGVPEADRERIFDAFFTTKPAGTGLGLAMSRQIASELGGTLAVSRDSRLGGALFRFRLPTL